MPPKKRRQVKQADKPTKQRRTQSPKVALPTSQEDPEMTATDSRPEIQQAGPSHQNRQAQPVLNISSVKFHYILYIKLKQFKHSTNTFVNSVSTVTTLT